MRIGTVSVVVKATTGAVQYSHDAVSGDDDLLVEQLPEVAVGLEDAGSLAALHPFFELQDDALEQGREQKRVRTCAT